MSLSRKFLIAMGIEEDKVDEIVKAHSETVAGLKDEIEKYKSEAGNLEEVKAELAKAKEELKAVGDDAKYKVKYDEIKAEYDKYKSDIANKETKANKTKAFSDMLKEAGIGAKRIEKILAVSGKEIDSIEFDEEGNPKEKETLLKSIKEDWGDFIETQTKKGASTAKPPANTGGGKMTKEEIRAIDDPMERQKAMMENPELFGIEKK